MVSFPQASSRADEKPTKRALLIGINYRKNLNHNTETDGPHAPLVGPHRDVTELRQLLIDRYEYEPSDIVVMMDGVGDDHLEPNRDNILREIKNLVQGARPGDHFLFHYSGHSGQVVNEDRTEEDGLDEVLIPSDDQDFDKLIVDDELRTHLVDPLPVGSSLVAIIDCCHSASMLDLEHHRCNRVYTPWVYNGSRNWSDSRRAGMVRRLAVVTSVGPSLHIYENHRVDRETVQVRRTSLDLSSGSRRASMVSMSSSLRSLSRQASFTSDDSTEIWYDAPESPLADLPATPTSPRRLFTGSDMHYSLSSSRASNSPIPVCDSPIQMYCSGFCDPNTDEKPYIVCVAACKDSQESWESEDGRSMTMAMIDYLRDHPHPKLDDLLKYISHSVYNLSVERHQEARKLRRKLKDSNDPAEYAMWEYLIRPALDEQYQDPQVSSLDPLDMQAEFTL